MTSSVMPRLASSSIFWPLQMLPDMSSSNKLVIAFLRNVLISENAWAIVAPTHDSGELWKLLYAANYVHHKGTEGKITRIKNILMVDVICWNVWDIFITY